MARQLAFAPSQRFEHGLSKLQFAEHFVHVRRQPSAHAVLFGGVDAGAAVSAVALAARVRCGLKRT